MQLSDFKDFNVMLTPTLIKVVYYLGAAGIVLAGLGNIFTYSSYFGFSFFHLLMTLLFVVTGFIFWRIMCELYIVIFKIHDRLKEMR